MADTLTAPGVVGQMYENRKSKKVYVLESREMKYKTLLLRDEDGESISINYSTFRSNYRKYKGDKKIYTSSQVTGQQEEKEREKRVSKDVKEKVKKKSKKKMSAEEKGSILASIRESLEKYAGENTIVSSKASGAITLKRSSRTLVEFWPETNSSIYIACNLKLWDDYFRNKLDESILSKASFMEKWKLQIKVSAIPFELIDGLAYIMCEAFEKYASEIAEAEKKAKEEKKATKAEG